MERKSSPGEIFHYDTSLTGRSFRLLTLVPGQGDEDIGCTLTSTTLDSEVDFEAISYAWGDPTLTRRLWCNGKLSALTESLYSVLWQLREEGHRSSLWADAVCINQSDTAEKTQQVRMIQHIYAKARNVIVWLGKEEETDRQGMELMKQIYERVGVLDISKDPEDPCAGPEDFGLPPASYEGWSAVIIILGRAWFDRVWVIQEILSAQSYTARCGAVALQPELLQVVSAKLLKYPGIGPAIIMALEEFRDCRNHAVILGLKMAVDRGLTLNLRNLLALSGDFKSTDVRDRVFALIGVSSDGDSRVVDYGASFRDVLLQVSKQEWQSLATSNGAPAGLASLTFVRHSPRLENLPSWVPDLGVPYFRPLHMYYDPVRSKDNVSFEKVNLLGEVSYSLVFIRFSQRIIHYI